MHLVVGHRISSLVPVIIVLSNYLLRKEANQVP